MLTIDPAVVCRTNKEVRLHLEWLDIESTPFGKPMHLQPLYRGCDIVGGKVSGEVFDLGFVPAQRILAVSRRQK